MYIEDRLFSESEQEVYYSVILDEDEARLFSEFQKEFGIITTISKYAPSLGKKLTGLKEKIINGKGYKKMKESWQTLKNKFSRKPKENLSSSTALVPLQ